MKNTKSLEELKAIWDGLDAELQECAKDPFPFGLSGRRATLNQGGMSELILHLEKHGYEIVKKTTLVQDREDWIA